MKGGGEDYPAPDPKEQKPNCKQISLQGLADKKAPKGQKPKLNKRRGGEEYPT